MVVLFVVETRKEGKRLDNDTVRYLMIMGRGIKVLGNRHRLFLHSIKDAGEKS